MAVFFRQKKTHGRKNTPLLSLGAPSVRSIFLLRKNNLNKCRPYYV